MLWFLCSSRYFCVGPCGHSQRNQLLRKDLSVVPCAGCAGGLGAGGRQERALGHPTLSRFSHRNSFVCFYCTCEMSRVALPTLCGIPYYFVNDAVPVCNGFPLALLLRKHRFAFKNVTVGRLSITSADKHGYDARVSTIAN